MSWPWVKRKRLQREEGRTQLFRDLWHQRVDLCEDLCTTRTQYAGKVTLEEIKVLMEAVVDYHRVCNFMSHPDPVCRRVRPIFNKYDIKVEHADWGGGTC